MTFAFFGSTEIIVALLVGLVLFGGKLPGVLREVAKFVGRARGSINEARRESGVDDVLRDLRGESDDFQKSASSAWSEASKDAEVDRSAGPAKDAPPENAETE